MRKGPHVVLAVAIVVVLLLATATIRLAEWRRNATFPVNSPQFAVQEYLRTISEGDKTKAFSFVSKESSCKQQDMDAAFGAQIDRSIVQFAHVKSDRATVGVRLELTIGSVFGGRSSSDHDFSLRREESGWKLIGTIWPMESCG